MATNLNIPIKYEGSTLSAPEFNAVVTAINENADTLQETYDAIVNKLNITEIVVQTSPRLVYAINSVESLIEYLAIYGTATPTNNTPPIIRIKQTTYIYKKNETLSFDIDVFDVEGGQLTLVGVNPTVTGGFNTFIVENLRSGTNTIDLNQLVYNNTTSMLPTGTYDFTEIYVVDKLGRSSLTPINLKIIIGSITLTSLFDSSVAYEKNTAISVRYGISSITNILTLTYKLSGKVLVVNELTGDFEYQTYAEKVSKVENYQLVSNETDFVTGTVYYINYVLPTTFSDIGDYTLTIQAEGEGDVAGTISNLLSINVVVNEPGVLYSSTSFNINGTYYSGDSLVIPVNIYYDEDPTKEYIYQCNAFVDGLPITGQSSPTSEQKGIQLKLTLPDDADLYTIKYSTVILTPSNEVYKTNVNYIPVQAKQKSKYAVVTDSSTKIELYLTAKGKSNSQANWLVWENRYNLSQDYYGLLYNFSSIIGWEEQVESTQHIGDALETNGSAYVNVNYFPFKNFSTNNTGLTIDFSIRHGDLLGENLYNLSIGKPLNSPKKGVYVRNNVLEINGLDANISVPIICDRKILTKLGEWATGDEYAHITITFDVVNKEVFVYLNGVISSYSTFSSNSSLEHDYPIILNGYLNATNNVVGNADTKLRFIRVYKSCLTAVQVLNNYIASYPSDVERILLEDLNDEITPILSVAYMKGDRAGIIKDEMRRLFYSFIPGNEELITDTYIPNPIAIGTYGQEYMDMKNQFPVDVDLQGNSSLSYPVKNYGMDIFDGEAWDVSRAVVSKEYNMVLNVDKVVEYRPWPDWDSYHLKANYIDSSHCNNLIMAKLSEQVFRLPYNWSDIGDIFPQTDPFKNFTVTRPDLVIDQYSRFPVYPYRLAIDGFPFIMRGDYTNSNSEWKEKEFIGLYTWNMKQHRKLYNMLKPSEDPNRRYFIYRCESNGDSVHEELRSGYCKFIDLTQQPLYLDSYGRVLSPSYIASQEESEMFSDSIPSEYSWFAIDSTDGNLQSNGLYTWIKYATTINDSNISDSPISRLYVGIAINKNSSVKSTNYSDYTWTTINIQNSISNGSGTYSLIQYSASIDGTGMNGSVADKSFIGVKYNVVKRLWVAGVDYFDKTGDHTEMQWRQGAELIMDWECREPDDMGVGHWEEFINNTWVSTDNVISAKDMNASSTVPDKILRFVWDRIKTSTGDANRSGNTATNYWTSIVNSNIQIPTLSDPNQTFSAIDKNKGIAAGIQHVDFLNAIKWMSNAPDECFGNPKIFEKYFDLRNCLDYVLCCFTFCLTDSIGRNLTMIAWDQDSVKVNPGIMDRTPMRFYPVFYDIDTAFGTNVQGGLYSTPYIAWPYDIGTRYIAEPGAGQEYNCFGTNFLKRISKCYETALVRRYQELRSGTYDPVDPDTKISAPFDYNNILQLYNKQMVGRIGERYFNKDAVYKYIGFENDPDVTAKRNYITNARGNKVMFMKNFLKKRMEYIDGIMGYVPDTEDMAYIQHYSQGQLTLGIETTTAGYVRISFAQNQVVSIYCNGVTPAIVSYNYPAVTQHILRIYNCAIVTNITGLSSKDVRIARLNSMTSLKYLDLSGNPNFGLENSTIAISGCKSLLNLNLTGCNGVNPLPIDISGCVQLSKFLVSNSSVSDVTFSTNLNLTEIDIRSCPNFNTLSVAGLYKLTSLLFDPSTLLSLEVSNSSINLDFSQPNTYNNLLSLMIVNNISITSLKFDPSSFVNLTKLFISDCPELAIVEDLFLNRSGNIELNTNFLGNCRRLVTIRNIFKGSTITTVPTGLFSGTTTGVVKYMTGCFQDCKNLVSIPGDVTTRVYTNLEDVTDIFNGAVLQTYTNEFGVDEEGNPIIVGYSPVDVFKSESGNVFCNCGKLKNVTRAFYGAELINAPVGTFKNSTILTTLDYCFANIVNPISSYEGVPKKLNIPNVLFTVQPYVSSAIGVFENTEISSVSNDIFSNFPRLKYAQNLFAGSKITTIPTNIFALSPLLENVSRSFACSGISSIPSGTFSNLPKLTNVTNLFQTSSITTLPTGFLNSTAITKFKFGDLGLSNLTSVNYDILSNSIILLVDPLKVSVLNDITDLFVGTSIITSPNDLLSNNLAIATIDNFAGTTIQTIGTNFLKENSIVHADNLFENKTKPLTLNEGFMKNSLELLTCDNMFKGSSIQTVNIDVLNNCPKLVSAEGVFYNCAGLTLVDSGFLENAPLLANILNIFKNTSIPEIKDRVLVNPNISTFKFSDILTHKISISNQFLSGSILTNIDNLFTGTLIEVVPDDFLTGVDITIAANLLAVYQIFYNSAIKTIGIGCFDNVKMPNASKLFTLCNSLVSIGDDFMINSGVTDLSSMFYNHTNVVSIGNNFMGGQSLVTTANAMFEGCSSLTTISILTNSPSLTDVGNIFKGCNLLTSLPIDFIILSPLVNSLVGVFDNLITSIPNNFCQGNTGITSLAGTFTNSNIETIGNNFMYDSTGLLNVDSIFSGNIKIKTIGNNFCASVITSVKVTSAQNTFKNSSIETVGDTLLLNRAVTNVLSMFENCTSFLGDSVNQIVNYFSTNKAIANFNRCFYGDESILGVTPLSGTYKTWLRANQVGYPTIISGVDCFYANNGLSEYLAIPSLWGGPLVRTFNISSSGSTITNSSLTCDQYYEKISETQFKVYVPLGQSINWSISADIHTTKTGISTPTVDSSETVQLIYQPLRTLTVTEAGSSTLISGTLIINNIGGVIANPSTGVYTYRGDVGQVTGTFVPTNSNYITSDFTWPTSPSDSSHSLQLVRRHTVTFVVNKEGMEVLSGVTVTCEGEVLTTDVNGNCVYNLFPGVHTYSILDPLSRILPTSGSFTVAAIDITVTVNGEFNWESMKPANPYNYVQLMVGGTNPVVSIDCGTDSGNFIIHWGDGATTTASGWGTRNHTYSGTNMTWQIEITSDTKTGNIYNAPTYFRKIDYMTTNFLYALWSVGNSRMGSNYGNEINLSGQTALRAVGSNIFKYETNREYYGGMFSGCTNLRSIPAGLFLPCAAAKIFSSTFYNCTSLKSLPANLFISTFSTTIARATTINQMFMGCTALKNFNVNSVFYGCSNIVDASQLFQGCTSLVELPNGLMNGFTGLTTNFFYAFRGCTALTTVGYNLFDYCRTQDYIGTFLECEGITSAVPPLWILFPSGNHDSCYKFCFNAANYADIPNGWKGL